MKERDVQRLICDWLRAERVFFIRMNVGVMQMGKRFVRFGERGMADLLAFVRVPLQVPLREESRGCSVFRVVWIEVKKPGCRQSIEQQAFQGDVESKGMLYVLADSLESVQEALGVSSPPSGKLSR